MVRVRSKDLHLIIDNTLHIIDKWFLFPTTTEDYYKRLPHRGEVYMNHTNSKPSTILASNLQCLEPFEVKT